jgi:hypothetical protein
MYLHTHYASGVAHEFLQTLSEETRYEEYPVVREKIHVYLLGRWDLDCGVLGCDTVQALRQVPTLR